jgi:ubiquinone/menaquinone biosynthesis C-methylase UbiE/uncharacterized protein YbaR (Trm112 family)
MKTDLIDRQILICPCCNIITPLKIGNIIAKKNANDISDGILLCDSCCQKYEIKEGIPLLYPVRIKNPVEMEYRDKEVKRHPMATDLNLWIDANSRKNKIIFSRIKKGIQICQQGDLVLDIGCGYGYYWLPFIPSARPLMFDFSLQELIITKKRYANKGIDVDCIAGDALCLPFNNNIVPFILSIQVYQHIMNFPAEIDTAFKKIALILKENGLFYYNQLNIPIISIFADLIGKGRTLYEDYSPMYCKKTTISQIENNMKKYFSKVETSGRYPWRVKLARIPGTNFLIEKYHPIAKLFARDIDAFCNK